MKWKLQISDPRNRKVLGTLLQTAEDWNAAREIAKRRNIRRADYPGDYAWRCRVWSEYTKKNITDWESED